MNGQTDEILVSLIVPVLNEERFIEECVHSLQKQDIPANQMEIILVDGNSTDGTMEILRRLERENPQQIRVLENPKRIQAAAMNLGAKYARGEYLARIDAHAEYPDNYVSTCIRLLQEKNAVNVGAACHTEAKTEKGKIIAEMLTTSFAVGGSSFRVGAESGYVETVPFGTFRRDYFLEIGGFDERLARNEDNEINYRIRKRDDKIYMTNEIYVTYYCRETMKALGKMAYANGKWAVIAAKLCPGSMSLKYFVPLAFAVSLIVMPLLSLLWKGFGILLGLELGLYFLLAFGSSLQKTRKWKEILNMIVLFPVFHVCYGIGSVSGIWSLLRRKY